MDLPHLCQIHGSESSLFADLADFIPLLRLCLAVQFFFARSEGCITMFQKKLDLRCHPWFPVCVKANIILGPKGKTDSSQCFESSPADDSAKRARTSTCLLLVLVTGTVKHSVFDSAKQGFEAAASPFLDVVHPGLSLSVPSSLSLYCSL